MQAQPATMYVENPLRERLPQLRVVRGETRYTEDRVKVGRALRDDPLGWMHHHRQIGESQYRAGREFQATWEAAGTPLASSGDIREYVDGGRGASDGITDARMRAGKALARYRALLGRDYDIVVAVLVNKQTVRQVADASRLMMPCAKSTVFHGQLFRRMLSRLAEDMGFG